jgi:ATP/maltotriose-dependent transcriptional regulator MalT
LYNHLKAELSPDEFALAVERSRADDLKAAVDQALVELDTSDQKSTQSTSNQTLADPLTDRELEALKLIAEGLSNRQIVEKLFLSLGTVKWYTNDIFSKLGVSSRTQATAQARELHLLP